VSTNREGKISKPLQRKLQGSARGAPTVPSKAHILVEVAEMQLDKLRKFIEEQQYKSEPTPQLLQAVGEHMMGVPSRSPEVVRLFLLAHVSTELAR
jgi:hypothetical protein